jgi:hypothetical protein
MARREKRGDEELTPEAGNPALPAETELSTPPDGVPSDDQAGTPSGKKVIRKVKKTWSFDERLARKVEIAAKSLGIEECDLVAKLIAPALKGVTLPTLPTDLRSLFAPKTKSAA